MIKVLLITLLMVSSPFARCGPLTYDFEVTVIEKGIHFAGAFTVVEDTWNDAILATSEVIDFSATVSDGNCCAYDFVPPNRYVPRARFPSFTVTAEALIRGSFFIRPGLSTFNLSLRQFFLDGSELRTSVHVNPNRQGGTSASVEYWDPGGVFNRDRAFADAIFDSNPFSGSPPFAFDLALQPAAVPTPTTPALLALGLAGLLLNRRRQSENS